MIKWTDEMKKFLKEERNRNVAYSIIAAMMSAKYGINITKNSAVSMGIRMGLLSEKGPGKKQMITRVVIKKPRVAPKPRPVKLVSIPLPEPEAIGPMNDFPEHGKCRWIAEDPTRDNWRCCGHDARGAFCAHHHARVYYKTDPAKDRERKWKNEDMKQMSGRWRTNRGSVRFHRV